MSENLKARSHAFVTKLTSDNMATQRAKGLCYNCDEFMFLDTIARCYFGSKSKKGMQKKHKEMQVNQLFQLVDPLTANLDSKLEDKLVVEDGSNVKVII